jgi:hypothetical protein
MNIPQYSANALRVSLGDAFRRITADIYFCAKTHSRSAGFLSKARRVQPRLQLISTRGNKWDHQSRHVTSRGFQRVDQAALSSAGRGATFAMKDCTSTDSRDSESNYT